MVTCKPATRKLGVDGKKQQVAGCEVVCKDTVLFPEGGGQNTDKGLEKLKMIEALGSAEVGLTSKLFNGYHSFRT